MIKNILAIGINTPLTEKQNLINSIKDKQIILKIIDIKDIIIQVVNSQFYIYVNEKNAKTSEEVLDLPEFINLETRKKSNKVFQEIDIVSYDFVWIQSGWNTSHIAYILHLYLKQKKVDHNIPNIHQTKFSDIFSLAKAGISIPNIYFHANNKISNKEKKNIAKICKFTCIYKTLIGSLGSEVYQIKTLQGIKRMIKNINEPFKYLFQEYIPNDFDYRVIIVNGQADSICMRIRENDNFRNNVALGAKEVFILKKDTPIEVINLAIKASKILKLKWSGVDIVVDKTTNKPYILEVNRRPGLTEFSQELSSAFKYLNDL